MDAHFLPLREMSNPSLHPHVAARAAGCHMRVNSNNKGFPLCQANEVLEQRSGSIHF